MRIWDHFENLRKFDKEPYIQDTEKAGARFNSGDMAQIQDMHDIASSLCGGVHCASRIEGDNDKPGDKPNEKPEAGMLGPDVKTNKRGSRHSATDMANLKKIHDTCCDMGAKCDQS